MTVTFGPAGLYIRTSVAVEHREKIAMALRKAADDLESPDPAAQRVH